MLLKITNLSKQYQRGQHDFWALRNANLTMDAGEFISIVGRSGSGKTTLLNLLAGILRPTAGNILFNNINIPALGDGRMSSLRNQCMGYIPQGNSLLGNLTVRDNIRLPFYLSGNGMGDAGQRASQLLGRVGLAHLANMYPASLSGGEARRVAIARALINYPKLLLADEPTSDLDTETAHEIMCLLQEFNQQGTAILLVTHDMEITSYSQKVISISTGRLTA